MSKQCVYPGCYVAHEPELYDCYGTVLCMLHGVQANRMLDAKYGEGAERDWVDVCRTVRAWLTKEKLQRGTG